LAQPLDPTSLQKLLDFLNRLDAMKFSYHLSHFREKTVAVELAVPGERWEVELYASGNIEIERFRSSDPVSGDGSILDDLFAKYV
jgi:uncharacterized protein (UPF0276 family)